MVFSFQRDRNPHTIDEVLMRDANNEASAHRSEQPMGTHSRRWYTYNRGSASDNRWTLGLNPHDHMTWGMWKQVLTGLDRFVLEHPRWDFRPPLARDSRLLLGVDGFLWRDIDSE